MLSVVTWKWKPSGPYRSRFGPETVNILKQMVRRHYHRPHRFICVTDDPRGIDPDIQIIPLWKEHGDVANPHGTGNPSCYRRLKIFSGEARTLFGERFVSLDLDTVIVNDLGPLWDRREDIVLWGDTNRGTHYNGSMILMTAGARLKVWTTFDPKRSPLAAKAAGQFGSDQGWIGYVLGPHEAKWGVSDGVFSFRLHIRNRRNGELPGGARIVMFHGSVDPWSPQAMRLNWVRTNWRYDPLFKNGVEAINLETGEAFLTDGRAVRIRQLFDEDGQQTNNLNSAVSFVAFDRDNNWWSDLLSHFRRINPH